MKRRLPRSIAPRPVPAPPLRGGTSLIEVLMSILVMGVGVVAVATLFPASVLRSLQATQLTNATVLRLNAESAIDLNQNLILDPDGNTGVYDEVRSDVGGMPPFPFVRNFVIDPYGYRQIDIDSPGNANFLGTNNPTILSRLPRFPGNTPRAAASTTGNLNAATTYVSQPDSWVNEYESLDFIPETTNQTNQPAINPAPQNARTTSVILKAADVTDRRIDLNELVTRVNGGDLLRVVLFDAEGRASEVRNLVSIAADDPIDAGAREIKWTASPLPDDPRYATISRVRFERFERRYSWIMTVHRNQTSAPSGSPVTAEVNVAVLFRRSVGPREELSYGLNILPATAQTSRPEYTVTKFDANDPEPFIKRGGFMLDPVNARWYRIASVGGTAAAPRIRFDRNPNSSEPLSCGVFFRGVIDVYPFTKQVIAP